MHAWGKFEPHLLQLALVAILGADVDQYLMPAIASAVALASMQPALDSVQVQQLIVFSVLSNDVPVYQGIFIPWT